MLFVMHRLQEFREVRKIQNLAVMRLVKLQKAYDPLDREQLWDVLARFGVPQKVVAIIS